MPGLRGDGFGSFRLGVRRPPKVTPKPRIRCGSEYQAERGSLFRSRSDMEDALDFIGWYNHKTWRQLGISRNDAEKLYLAYHEGRGGYRRGTWKKKPKLQRIARNVAATAGQYRSQLAQCQSRFRCDAWYQVWPLCR